MKWTELFKSKSKASKLESDPSIRWYGKLPTYGDYYISNTDQRWAVEFNDWVQGGVAIFDEKRRSAAAGLPKRWPIAYCIVRLPQSGMTVLASVLDFGGDNVGRGFPMCFYAAIPTSDWPGPTSDRAAGAIRALEDLGALRRRVIQFCNEPARFETVFGDRTVYLDGLNGLADESWRKPAAALPFDAWLREAGGIPEPDIPAWRKAANEWGDRLAGHESDEFEPTLRFPWSTSRPMAPQVVGWIRWLESRMDLSRRALSIMIASDSGNGIGRLTLVARGLLPEDFLLLTPLGGSLSYVDELAPATPAAPASADNAAAAPLGDPVTAPPAPESAVAPPDAVASDPPTVDPSAATQPAPSPDVEPSEANAASPGVSAPPPAMPVARPVGTAKPAQPSWLDFVESAPIRRAN